MPILQTVVAGLVGTAFMTVLMTFIHRAKWANADMIRALGSLVTRKMDGAAGVGVVIHAVSGIAFAFAYTIILTPLAPHGGLAAALLGAVIGLVHGIVVSYLLIAVVSEKHPIEQFRKAGLEVAAAHLAGHVGYGFGVGVMAAALNIHWATFA